MHLGCERPPSTGPGTGSGGWQRGSLTPQMPPSLLPAASPHATRAAENAARCSAVKSQIAKNIATSSTDAITFLSRLVDQRTAHEQGGPLLPSLCSPLLSFALRVLRASKRRGSARLRHGLNTFSDGSLANPAGAVVLRPIKSVGANLSCVRYDSRRGSLRSRHPRQTDRPRHLCSGLDRGHDLPRDHPRGGRDHR